MVSLRVSLFLTGFVSLFSIPSYGNFILVHLFLLISLYLTSVFFILSTFKKQIYLKTTEVLFIGLALLYLASTLLGVLNSHQSDGVYSSFLFLLVFLLIFMINKINHQLIFYLLKGFVFSSIVTAIYVFVDATYFYINGISLNETLFSQKFLGKANDHTLSNVSKFGDFVYYRPAGFSWDPGLSITGIVVGIILLGENIIAIKYKKLILFIMTLSVILSSSKTSIIALIFYFLVKIFRMDKLNIKVNLGRISLISIIFIGVFLLLLYIGFFVPYDGTVDYSIARHLKYRFFF